MRTQVGTFLAQRGFVRHAQLDRGINLTCINTGGRGRYRTADRWCVKGQDSMDYRSGVSNRCRSAEFRCPVCAVVSTLFVPVLGHSWPTGGLCPARGASSLYGGVQQPAASRASRWLPILAVTHSTARSNPAGPSTPGISMVSP